MFYAPTSIVGIINIMENLEKLFLSSEVAKSPLFSTKIWIKAVNFVFQIADFPINCKYSQNRNFLLNYHPNFRTENGFKKSCYLSFSIILYS